MESKWAHRAFSTFIAASYLLTNLYAFNSSRAMDTAHAQDYLNNNTDLSSQNVLNDHDEYYIWSVDEQNFVPYNSLTNRYSEKTATSSEIYTNDSYDRYIHDCVHKDQVNIDQAFDDLLEYLSSQNDDYDVRLAQSCDLTEPILGGAAAVSEESVCYINSADYEHGASNSCPHSPSSTFTEDNNGVYGQNLLQCEDSSSNQVNPYDLNVYNQCLEDYDGSEINCNNRSKRLSEDELSPESKYQNTYQAPVYSNTKQFAKDVCSAISDYDNIEYDDKIVGGNASNSVYSQEILNENYADPQTEIPRISDTNLADATTKKDKVNQSGYNKDSQINNGIDPYDLNTYNQCLEDYDGSEINCNNRSKRLSEDELSQESKCVNEQSVTSSSAQNIECNVYDDDKNSNAQRDNHESQIKENAPDKLTTDVIASANDNNNRQFADNINNNKTKYNSSENLSLSTDNNIQHDNSVEVKDDNSNTQKNSDQDKHNQVKIKRYLISARAYYFIHEYDQALKDIDTYLESEPNSEVGINLRNEILKHISERQMTKKNMIDFVDRSWEMPKIETEIDEQSDSEEELIFAKLNQIIIPQISFNNTPISVAINTIIDVAERYDQTNISENKGINIVLMEPSTVNEPTVSLSLKNMSLDKILNFIAKSSLYQYDIEDGAVVFHKAANKNIFNLDTKFFKISRSAVIRMTGYTGQAGTGNGISSGNSDDRIVGGGDGDSGSSSESLDGSSALSFSEQSLAESEALIKNFLQKSGINFSSTPGSSMAFDGSQLIVTQTIRNLKRVEEILKRYEQVKQVEIETKFIEVQEGTLDELNFNFTKFNFGKNVPDENSPTRNRLKYELTNTKNTRTLQDAFTIGNAATSNGTIVQGTNTIPIPNAAPRSPGGLDLGESASALACITGVIEKRIDMALAIRALEQKSGTNLMSAPKLTVLSGKTAKITVAQEFIYPKTYGEIESEVGSSSSDSSGAGVTITAGTPSDFVTRNVGVEMCVTPTIEENNCISLHLLPRVTEFEGFIEYGGRSIAIQGNTTVEVPPGFFQPIFATREIDTEVTIYDGATVVMGGLTREETKEVHDKIPLLGDIPFIGKLFSSKGETSHKKNLLIFVTANIVSPGGALEKNKQYTPSLKESYKTSHNSHWPINQE